MHIGNSTSQAVNAGIGLNERDKTLSTCDEFSKLLAQKKEEIEYKVAHGETEPSVQIGAQSFTDKQWNSLIDKIDKAEEAVKEEQAERAKKLEEAEAAKI